jgi:hypothetical protein
LGTSALPAALLFGTTSQVKDFYNKNFIKLKEQASVLAQNSSGGSNKLLRNFEINPNSLLIATDKFIIKNLSSGNGYVGIEQLPVKTLVLCHLPFEQFTHPYQEALAAKYSNSFEDFALPRAIYNFHSILKFFNTENLANVYIWDSKLAKGYAKVFEEYVSQIPGVEIVT